MMKIISAIIHWWGHHGRDRFRAHQYWFIGGGASIVLLFIVLGIVWHSHSHIQSLLHPFDNHSTLTDQSVWVVKPQSITQTLVLTGKLNPGDIVTMVAPFTGAVEQLWVQYGSPVVKGDRLLALETAQVQTQLWDAQKTLFQAQEDHENILQWKSSTEVLSAKRQLEEAQEHLASAEREAKDTAMLYDKGIVSGDENANSIQQLHSAIRSLASAQENLHSVLDRGDEQAVESAHLTLQAATQKYDELYDQINAAILYAPIAGVAMRPLQVGSGNRISEKDLAIGQVFSMGDAIIRIADLDDYTVLGVVDEIEINKLALGQAVTVTGTAFPGLTLSGEVSGLSQHAVTGQQKGLAHFVVQVTIPKVTPEQRKLLRIGMTAHMAITTYRHENAIVLPSNFIQGDIGHHWVWVQAIGDTPPEKMPVVTGIVTLDGVEIISGLKIGDRVIRTHSDEPSS